jgi:hypothetical protein
VHSGVTNLASGIIDKLPIDVSIPLPVLLDKRNLAISVDLGGAGLSARNTSGNIADVLPGGVTNLLPGVVDKLPANVSVSAPVLTRKR